MTKSGASSKLQRIQTVLNDIARRLRNSEDPELRRLGRDAEDAEHTVRQLISQVRQHWTD